VNTSAPAMKLSEQPTAEYSVRAYSSVDTQDLNAVDAIERRIHAGSAYQKFALAQFADIIGDGFLVAEKDGEVVGHAVVTLDAADAERGTILTLAVEPAHDEHAARVLKRAADEHLAARGRKTDLSVRIPAAPAPGRLVDASGKYEIRRFCAEDLTDVLAVEHAAFADDPYSARLFEQMANVLGDGFFVAVWHGEHGSKVVGYLLAVLDAMHMDFGWVMSVAVLPEHRGERVGFELMESAEQYFGTHDCDEVFLTVDPMNVVAVGLYKHRNYTVAETHDDHHGLNLPRLVMRQRLFVDTIKPSA
jgi:ribosomal protein S18 acetylase RimI-like enzyme